MKMIASLSPNRSRLGGLLAPLFAILTLPLAFAAHTSEEALLALERRFGPDKFDHIVSMTARGGAPTPGEWWVVVRDPTSPSTLHTYWSGGRRVTDEGVNGDFYPKTLPDGFIDAAKMKIDSTRAFTIVEREASRERVGFNEVSYDLRAISFTDEPVWTLTLIDARGHRVGVISLSAKTGTVLRQVWFRPGIVRDSLAPKPAEEVPPAIGIEEPGALRPLPEVNSPDGLIPTTPTREADVQDIVPVPLPDAPENEGFTPLPPVDAPIQPAVEDGQRRPIAPEPEPVRPATGGAGDSLYEEITPEEDDTVPGP